MRRVRIVILLLLLNIPLSFFAESVDHSKKEVEEVLVELDGVIARKKSFLAERQTRVDSLEQIVNSCTIDVYVEKCKELFDALYDYDGREALKALQRIEKTEEYEKDPNLQAWVKLNASTIYGIMGLYYRADQLVRSIDPSVLSRDERLHYYLTLRDNYEKIAEYMADISIVVEEEKQMVTYYDNIIDLLPEGNKRDIFLADKEVYLHSPQRAVDMLSTKAEKIKGEDYYTMCLTLADANELLVDLRHNFIQLSNVLRCTHAGYNILALRIEKELTHEVLLAVGRITCESNTGTGSIAHVAECHHLYVNSGTPGIRDIIVAAVYVRTGVVP